VIASAQVDALQHAALIKTLQMMNDYSIIESAALKHPDLTFLLRWVRQTLREIETGPLKLTAPTRERQLLAGRR
jgi:hypothetical protein